MALTLGEIEGLLRSRGGEQYAGEPVTQLEHALQSAALAEQEGADDELVTAALLHDLGHLVHDLGATPTLSGVDDVHQHRVVRFLRGRFGERVVRAIQLHVDAKRYLCTAEPGYFDTLSEDSVRSLALQGGPYSPHEAARFAEQVGAAEAVRLRRWDDLAKTAGAPTPDLGHFLARAARVALDA
jgi:phosphonate degradation associated HDIG domain protein